ncbi:MAG: ABC transporter substrate-binding protein [Ruegeria sp.]|uniref:ABC transporter substrate-binding protein n=1 Tax=Roseovarius sp. ZX-A-9 TaxID=3014783 RepID=UPI002330AA74|nr:ABC transporter substrate-binding protein [Roseovarius sp. ZX-A-9]MDX1742612.1 ABC transporter substrate-binding protein [Ruegeria sp.]
MRVIRIRLLWHKQAQFAGYLLAEKLQLARKAGVEIVCEGLDFSCKHVASILTGQAEMAVASPAHLMESADPDRLRWLMTIQQKSPLVYPARRSDGISELGDLRGRKVGVWPGGEDLEFRWMLHHAGISEADVERVEMPDTVTPFLDGETSSGQMTVYHELHAVEDQIPASDLVLFDAQTLNCSILKDGLVADAGLCRDEPQVVQAVVDAVLEGWSMTIEDPEQALDACCEARPDMSRAMHADQLRQILDLSLVGATRTQGLGYPDPAHMERAAQAMRDIEGHAPDTGPLRDARFWEAAPDQFRRTEWPAERSK